MNRRLLLSASILSTLLVGFGAWWVVDGRSGSAPPIDRVTSSNAPSVSAPLEPADPARATTSPREIVQLDAPIAKTASNPLRRTSGMISGRVTSAADGSLIIGADVRLEGADGTSPLEPTLSMTSDLTGQYEIYGVPVGDWKLVCSARSFTQAEVRVSMTIAGGKKQQDFRLQPDPRTNVVLHLSTPGGQPLFDHLGDEDAALVDLLRPVFVEQCPQRNSDLPPGTRVITFQGRAVDHKHAVTDEWQRVQLGSERSACCAVLFADRVLDTAAFAAGMSDLTLVVSIEDLHRATGSLHLAIVDAATNAPLAGARVSLRPAAGPTRIAATDAEGRAEIVRVMPGEAVCEIDAVGHALVTKKATIEAGKSADLGTIQLPATLVVSGTIDMPAPGKTHGRTVFVHAYRLADQEGRALETTIAVQPDGTFEFPRMFPGEYVIGWRRMDPPPAPALVRSGELFGWAYADARSGSVRGVHIPVKATMWDPPAGNVGTSR